MVFLLPCPFALGFKLNLYWKRANKHSNFTFYTSLSIEQISTLSHRSHLFSMLESSIQFNVPHTESVSYLIIPGVLLGKTEALLTHRNITA